MNEGWEKTGGCFSEDDRRIAWMHGELSWSLTAEKPEMDPSTSLRTRSIESLSGRTKVPVRLGR